MVRETDLPCSDCGTALVERSIDTRELPVSPEPRGSVEIAECPDCGARFFPKESLERLASQRDSDLATGR